MEFTGERYVPGVAGPIKLEHLQRYALCRPVVRGRRVLDLACGEGYGSAMLAATASRVVGIDIDPDAISHARATYGHLADAEFVVGACDALPLADKSLDVVVSFETIEHHDHQVEMIREIRRVLAPGGVFIVSSPNKPVYDAISPHPNQFHVRELDLSELEALLRSEFPHVALWGQRLAVGCFTYALGRPVFEGPAVLQALTIVDHDVLNAAATLESPVYVLAACSDIPLEPGALGFDSVSIEPADDLYAQLAAAIRQYEGVHREAQTRADRLQGDLQAAHGAREETVRVVDGLRAHVEALRALQAAEGETLTFARARGSDLQRALDVMHGSRSWRWTAPLRDVGQALRRARRALAPRTEGLLRMGYRRLPVPSQVRWKLKISCFTLLGWLLRETESYQRWYGTARRPPVAFPVPELLSFTEAGSWPPIKLPACGEPMVSVIIPVFGRIDLTWRCLTSIGSHPPETPMEVLVVDDASPDDTAERLSEIEHLRLIRLEQNQGFIRACNRGASEARGRYLLFLNNDTAVGPGWCDELIRTFADVPNAGIVGAKVLYPDGRLQEAGGIIWKDGSGGNDGRDDDPLKPEYSYRREVDYLSGAALAVPRDLFAQLGGFHER